MKTIILLAARMKSTRLPGKQLVMVEDQTITEHLIDRLKLCKKGELILCTSINKQDDPLIEVAKKKGIKWFRGSEENIIDRFLRCAEQEGADIVVRTTGDNIFTDPFLIDRAIEYHIAKKADYTIVDGSPDLKAEVISINALRKLEEIAINPEKSEYLTLYFRVPGLFKTESMMVGPGLRRSYRLTVDEQGDLDLVKEIFKKLYKKGQYMKSEDIIRFLDSHRELLELNKKAIVRDVSYKVIEKDGKRMVEIVDRS
ncbi:MAG: hypothetical protein V1870_03010 [Candidatus Aenigmatarchaeota archaeon]